MRFARIVLLLQAVVMLGFSLAYWVRPYEMANLNGMLLMETASVSHMRVYYGGLQLGLALFLLWSVRQEERARPALVLLVMVMLALVVGRLGSLWLDGGELIGFDLLSLIYRIVAAALAGTAWWMIRERPDGEHVPPPTRRLVDDEPQPFRLGDADPSLLEDEAERPAHPGVVMPDAPSGEERR